jgi:hypothetical protein
MFRISAVGIAAATLCPGLVAHQELIDLAVHRSRRSFYH